MRSIILLGYMGSGKTTIGHALSKEMGLQFYDLDWYIEMRFHKTVAQIFEERGEDGFREIERNMLHEVAEFENVIISCGGGTPCFFDNMDYMNSLCDTVYLKASAEVLAAHLKMGKVVRPLIVGKSNDELSAYIQDMLDVREPYYMKAKYVVDVNLLNSIERISESTKLLRDTLGI